MLLPIMIVIDILYYIYVYKKVGGRLENAILTPCLAAQSLYIIYAFDYVMINIMDYIMYKFLDAGNVWHFREFNRNTMQAEDVEYGCMTYSMVDLNIALWRRYRNLGCEYRIWYFCVPIVCAYIGISVMVLIYRFNDNIIIMNDWIFLAFLVCCPCSGIFVGKPLFEIILSTIIVLFYILVFPIICISLLIRKVIVKSDNQSSEQ